MSNSSKNKLVTLKTYHTYHKTTLPSLLQSCFTWPFSNNHSIWEQADDALKKEHGERWRKSTHKVRFWVLTVVTMKVTISIYQNVVWYMTKINAQSEILGSHRGDYENHYQYLSECCLVHDENQRLKWDLRFSPWWLWKSLSLSNRMLSGTRIWRKSTPKVRFLLLTVVTMKVTIIIYQNVVWYMFTNISEQYLVTFTRLQDVTS
jgi:hypothetical protein